MPDINTSLFDRYIGKIPERVRTFAMVALAFWLGTLISGAGGTNGRYVLMQTYQGGFSILDTRTGSVWDTQDHGTYKRVAGFSIF